MKAKILLITMTVYFIGFSINAQVTDKNGIVYKTVKIGTQIWMSENVKTTTFQNGDLIPEAKNVEDWIKAGKEGKPMFISWDKSSDIKDYGNLYNWYAITDKRGFAPKGWHIPSDKEWTILANFLGGTKLATDKLKSDSLRIGWEVYEGGSNVSGFSGYPGGKITPEGSYEDLSFYGYWWSSSESDGLGLNRNLSMDNSPFDSASSFKGNGFSVRCIKD